MKLSMADGLPLTTEVAFDVSVARPGLLGVMDHDLSCEYEVRRVAMRPEASAPADTKPRRRKI